VLSPANAKMVKELQQNLANSKLSNLKFDNTLHFSLNLCPKEEKFIQGGLVISKP
jgi:hypothetical protein